MRDVQRPTKILFVAPGLGSQGGIATVVENYSKTPFWKEFGCMAFASTTSYESRWVKLLNDTRLWSRFAFEMLTSEKPSVVSIHMAHDASFYRKFAYLLVCRIFHVPVVLHVHSGPFAQFAKGGSFVRRFAIRMAEHMADKIIVLSDAMRDSLAEFFPSARIDVLNNPVDISVFNAGPTPVKSERPHILFLGWIVREKGVYDLVEVIPRIVRSFPDALFTFAGNKEVRELRALLARRGLEDSTEVPGWVGGQKKIDLLRTSWVLALPSYAEGAPNVILEAMASRLPIMTTPVGGLPDILEHEQTAIFVEPGNVAAISDALIKLLAESGLRESLAAAAFQRALDYHSLEQVDRGLREIYDQYRIVD